MNAKNELLDILKEIKGTIKCAIINGTCYRNVSLNKLKCNHTQIEFELFINNLDFNYDAGFGGQELEGTVWLTDGTWLSRGEYDGSEWWEHNKLPDIPTELL